MVSLRKRLGAELEGRRKKLRLTRDALSERVGIEPQTLRNYEKGDRWPDPERIEALAAALECTPDELFTGSAAVPFEKYDRESRDWIETTRKLEAENESLRLALRNVLTDREREILRIFAALNEAQAEGHLRILRGIVVENTAAESRPSRHIK